jgi:hypothetical protein
MSRRLGRVTPELTRKELVTRFHTAWKRKDEERVAQLRDAIEAFERGEFLVRQPEPAYPPPEPPYPPEPEDVLKY